MNKGTLFLHLTSTFFPMLLFFPLMKSEHPDWNQFTSRETGLCPSNILFTQNPSTGTGVSPVPRVRLDAVKLEAPLSVQKQRRSRIWISKVLFESVPGPKSASQVKDPGCRWWEETCFPENAPPAVSRKGSERPTEVASCATGTLWASPGGQTIWCSPGPLPTVGNSQLTGARSFALSLPLSLWVTHCSSFLFSLSPHPLIFLTLIVFTFSA